MLVKVNDIRGNRVRVTKLDIDDFGSVIPLRELDLKLPQDDDSVSQILRYSEYAILFTNDDSEDDDGSTIILARSMTTEELNEEKERTVRAIHTARQRIQKNDTDDDDDYCYRMAPTINA